MINKIFSYIETDQLYYLEDKVLQYIEKEENVKISLQIHKIKKFLKENFKINIPTDISNYSIGFHPISDELPNFKNYIQNFDAWILALLENLTGITKSLTTSLALIGGVINPIDAYYISHSEEHYQKRLNGEVEGHHDITYEMLLGNFYSVATFNNLMLI